VNGGFEDYNNVGFRNSTTSTVRVLDSTPELPAYEGARYLEVNMSQLMGATPYIRSVGVTFPIIAGVKGKTYRVTMAVRSQTDRLPSLCFVQFLMGASLVTSYLDSGIVWEELSTFYRWNYATGTKVIPTINFSCPTNIAFSFGLDNVQFTEVADPPAIPESLPPPFRYV
jgi:hypothetical protein